jgi:RNA polymerase sigma-70 factor (ECF subfamily)
MVCAESDVVFSKIDPMNADPSQALEPFRSNLEVLARVHLDPRLRGKLDPADVVQQAMLRAYAAWPEMKNPQQPVLAAWLRRILARTLADLVKHYDRDRRAVDLERSFEAELDQSASALAGWVAADQTSPSRAAVRNEELLRLANALTALPEPQREVVVLKHLRGWTLQRIADHLGRTVPSVASYLRGGAGGAAAPIDAQGVNHVRLQRTGDVRRRPVRRDLRRILAASGSWRRPCGW